MKYCTICGTQLDDSALFCKHCGRSVTNGRAPLAHLKTDRSLMKLIVLSLFTFGIYGLIVWSEISTSINTVASKYDGKKTMHYLVVLLFGMVTLGIAPLVWIHRISDRIGNELFRRRIPYSFSSESFWVWGVFGCIIIIGPFIYCCKMLKAMNLLCEDYNQNG